MKIRFFLSLLLTVVFLLYNSLILGLGSNLLYLVDISSILIMIVFPLIFMWIFNGWKSISSAFLIIVDKNKNKKDLLNAKAFFENYGKTIFSIAFTAFIVAFIAMMKNLEDKAALGPNMALAAITLAYSGIINMIVILPFKIFINRKIIEAEG